MTVRQVIDMLEGLVDEAKDLPIDFFLEKEGGLSRLDLYTLSMRTRAGERRVEVWLIDLKKVAKKNSE